MKKIITVLLALALCLGMGTAVFADVAYEPDDSFYRKHWDECDYESRTYITNGAEGYAIVYSSPTGDAQDVIPNGKSFYVSWTWKGEWGCIEYDPETLASDYGGTSGWVRMTDVTPEYDSECFRRDHAEDISEESLTLMIKAGEEYFGYKYPGSGLVTATLGDFSGDAYTTVYIDGVYTDADGGRWGYVGYFFGMRNFWINLDTPNIQLGPGREYTEPEIIPAADEAERKAALQEASPFRPYVIAGAVGTVIIAAAVIAWVIIKKKK